MAVIPSFKINRAFNLKNVKVEDSRCLHPGPGTRNTEKVPSRDSEVQQNLSLALKAIPIGDRKVKSNVNN